jgi:hypothetical protein
VSPGRRILNQTVSPLEFVRDAEFREVGEKDCGGSGEVWVRGEAFEPMMSWPSGMKPDAGLDVARSRVLAERHLRRNKNKDAVGKLA